MVGRGGPGFPGAWGREWVDTHPTPRGGMAAGGFISKLFHLPPIQFPFPPVQSLPPKQKLKRSVRLKGHSGLASPQSRIHRLFDLEDAIPPSDGVVVLNDPLLLLGENEIEVEAAARTAMRVRGGLFAERLVVPGKG